MGGGDREQELAWLVYLVANSKETLSGPGRRENWILRVVLGCPHVCFGMCESTLTGICHICTHVHHMCINTHRLKKFQVKLLYALEIYHHLKYSKL